jgi:CRISPR-associated endonuclease/helicase Cas3
MKELKFVDFFRDIHGYPPLPWQARLAAKLVRDHEWPDLIDLPTASGKTACLDIALFHLACCAERGESWRAARRIVLAVDRRIIVDSAAERADKLRKRLTTPGTETLKRIAHALKSLGGSEPLLCEKLRGGMPREQVFSLDPAQPMIITSTVDQVGSRLLFRGYGVSPYSYPIHAGLLGHDTLILVDEAHLSAPFLDTLDAIRARQLQAERQLNSVRPVRVVPLSATVRAGGVPFRLDAKDLANKTLAERRSAKKPARLVAVSGRSADRVSVLAHEALHLYRRLDSTAPKVAVIVNRVRTARALYDALLKQNVADRFDLQLMIGRCRPLDRDEVTKHVESRVGVGVKDANDRGLMVVATQTIEVGADLDFQGLVAECAALDALRQRFGRLDRLGKFRKAQAVIVGDGGGAEDDPIYGAALRETWSWLSSVAKKVGGFAVVDFSIQSIERLTKGMDLSQLNTKPGLQLSLTPIHIDLLSQTAPTPMFDPDVQALLHGLRSGAPDVHVVWRADLPVASAGSLLDVSELDAAAALLEFNPPTSLEVLSLPLRDVRAWLQGRTDETSLTDIEGVPEIEPVNGVESKKRFVLRRSRNRWERASARDIKPSDTIVVPSTYGGCDSFGFAPEFTKAVVDLSSKAREELKRSKMVSITERWLAAIGVDIEQRRSIWGMLQKALGSQASSRELFALLMEEISPFITFDLKWLSNQPVLDVVRNAAGKLHAIVATDAVVCAGDLSDEDFSSSYTVPVSLQEHNAGVARHARRLAKKLSLEAEHVKHLACAGSFHDVGKAEPRTQEVLRSGAPEALPGQLLAKGKRRSGVGRVEFSERHEAYSVAFLRQYPELLKAVADPDLVLYLIGTHHGRGRALMPDRSDDGSAFAVEVAGRTLPFEGAPALGSLGAGWAAGFWRLNRRYGPWGIAYLESVLRLADWKCSEEEAKRKRA